MSRESLKEAVSFHTMKPEDQVVVEKPEPVDDFLRNFLNRAGLNLTLRSFEAEWYSSAQKTQLETPSERRSLPDALSHRLLLLKQLETAQAQTHLLKKEVLEGKENLVRMQRERDFHRLQHQKVTEQKKQLVEDLKRLKEHVESYEPVLRQLEEKHQAALKRNPPRRDGVPNSTASKLNQKEKKKEDNPPGKSPIRHAKDSTLPICCRLQSPQQVQVQATEGKSSFRLSSSIRAHELPINNVQLHPGKPMVASASDDRSWRLWALPAGGEKVGQMVLTGEGHSDWLSGCSFHPDGSKLATTSGDATVRLWDVCGGRCVVILSGHTQITWGCSFHSCGHFLASCSSDGTARLWDLNRHRCKLTLRRHTASVNSVSFLASSNLLLTCSADKTLAVWDARLGVCTSTFKGHQSPCNHASFSAETHAVASCDTGGVVHLWDLRKPASPTAAVEAGPSSANQVAFSQSGRLLAVAGGDSLVRLVDVASCSVSRLMGHKRDVQSVTFDHNGDSLVSAGSDGLILTWS
ncbi:sperm-associated antigen 16 protein [Nothobranchius furzeri]|uniref:Sperm associated antigen 16 n=1 Tax=Nothobranchius furzeri TaxID=105023 RepID=A0A1A7ZFU7_NOTFU|nr:sperm-associated antigen 16 protein-like [Nothobranchius furzeri]